MNFDCILLRPEQHAKQKPLMHSALSHSATPSLCAAVAATAGSYSGIEEAAVEEPVSAGGLEGTFTRPHKVSARGPAVLIISGSGPTDRDGNQSERKTNTYRMLATGLVAAGIRSLRYDKRGMGGSQALVAREQDVIFDDFVNDAVTMIRALSQRAEVSSVFVLGHSEGGIIALRAASMVPFAGLVLAATPGRPLAVVLRFQLRAALTPESLRDEALQILELLVKGGRVAEVPLALMEVFRPSVQPFLASLFPINPATELANLTLPVLLVQGERDIQIQREDYDALAKARPDAQSLLIATMNHMLKPAPIDREGNIKAYTDPTLQLHPFVVPRIVAFIRSVVVQ